MVRESEGSLSESHCTLSEQYVIEENPAGGQSGVVQTGLGQSSCHANRTAVEDLREECVSVDSRKALRGHHKHCCVQ